jgi:hypothetical protein
MPDEKLRVTVEAHGRIEIEGLGLVLALEPEDGQISILVFAGDVTLGHMLVARDGVEVARTGEWRGTMVEWTR